jgi:hypothetical protein
MEAILVIHVTQLYRLTASSLGCRRPVTFSESGQHLRTSEESTQGLTPRCSCLPMEEQILEWIFTVIDPHQMTGPFVDSRRGRATV